MDKTWKIVIGGSAAALAVVAIAFSLALLPNPIFAAAPPFGMYGHGGPWANGFGQWHGGPYFTNGTGNWTGSVSINSLKIQTINAIKDKVKISVNDAAATAEKSLGSGSRIGSVSLAPVNGYLVYVVFGIDASDNIHRLVVDVGNANVLESRTMDLSQSSFGPSQWGQWH